MLRNLLTTMLVLMVFLFTGCSEHAGPLPTVPSGSSPGVISVSNTDVEFYEGELDHGALYAVYAPANWNGDLVLYQHGYVDPAMPVALPDFQPVRDALLSLGYGVAYSSFAENGFAIKDGIKRARQLRGVFISHFATPDRVYLVGESLGATISLMAAEKNSGLYDGALPISGFVGGSSLEVEYIFNTRVLFDYFFPGVIPGDALNTPEGLDFFVDVLPGVVGAILSNPGAAFELAGVDQIELPYTSAEELVNSIVFALYFQVVSVNDFLDRTHQHPFYSNVAIEYSGSSDDAALNEGVDRFDSTPDARQYVDHYYQPTGELTIPVLTLHTSMDPVVPLFHEAVYASIVADAGRSEYLVQRTIDRYGHVTFTTGEIMQAFTDLAAWVETGVAPMP